MSGILKVGAHALVGDFVPGWTVDVAGKARGPGRVLFMDWPETSVGPESFF